MLGIAEQFAVFSSEKRLRMEKNGKYQKSVRLCALAPAGLILRIGPIPAGFSALRWAVLNLLIFELAGAP